MEERKRKRERNNLHHFFIIFPTQAHYSRFLSSESVCLHSYMLCETVALVIVILYIKSLVSRSALMNEIDNNYRKEIKSKIKQCW